MIYPPFITDGFPPRFPENIARLFSLTSKAEVKAYAQRLVLDRLDIACAIVYAELGGYTHAPLHYEWQPEAARLKPEDVDILRNEDRHHDLDKFVRKFDNALETRKRLSAHFFEKPGRWHLFYFTLGDMASRDPNHWEHGSHLHFVNFLWPEYKLEEMQDRLFRQRKTQITGLHIRVNNKMEEDEDD
jgi:hypothetical protein